MRGLGGAAARPRPLLAVPNATAHAHSSTASLPVTVLLYNGTLFCGFNVPIKGLKETKISIVISRDSYVRCTVDINDVTNCLTDFTACYSVCLQWTPCDRPIWFSSPFGAWWVDHTRAWLSAPRPARTSRLTVAIMRHRHCGRIKKINVCDLMQPR